MTEIFTVLTPPATWTPPGVTAPVDAPPPPDPVPPALSALLEASWRSGKPLSVDVDQLDHVDVRALRKAIRTWCRRTGRSKRETVDRRGAGGTIHVRVYDKLPSHAKKAGTE